MAMVGEYEVRPEEPRANRCYETMTRVETPFFTIRVWRTERELFDAIDADDLGANNDIRRAVQGLTSKRAIFLALEALPRVAAIEVLDRQTGDGALLYPDWR